MNMLFYDFFILFIFVFTLPIYNLIPSIYLWTFKKPNTQLDFKFHLLSNKRIFLMITKMHLLTIAFSTQFFSKQNSLNFIEYLYLQVLCLSMNPIIISLIPNFLFDFIRYLVIFLNVTSKDLNPSLNTN